MSKINYYWNELYNECIEQFNASYEIMLDTRDYVPISHIEEDQKALLKRRKKLLRRISREERRFRRRLGPESLRYYECLDEQLYIDEVSKFYAKAKEKAIIVEGETVKEEQPGEVVDGKSLETAKAEQAAENADVSADEKKGEDSDVRAQEV